LRRWYKKLYGFEHSLWEDGGGNLVVSVDGDDTDAVVEWLERIGMGSYSAPFIEQTVDVSLLKSLSLKDLRDELGVTNMSDRRRIFNGILMLLSRDVDKYALPEDGRILTHLFNVRVFNAWIRCAVQVKICPDSSHLHLVSDPWRRRLVVFPVAYFRSSRQLPGLL